jgi:hypothetical protein
VSDVVGVVVPTTYRFGLFSEAIWPLVLLPDDHRVLGVLNLHGTLVRGHEDAALKVVERLCGAFIVLSFVSRQEIELKCHREKKKKKRNGWLAHLVLDEGVDIVASVVELCPDETLKSARAIEHTGERVQHNINQVTKRC